MESIIGTAWCGISCNFAERLIFTYVAIYNLCYYKHSIICQNKSIVTAAIATYLVVADGIETCILNEMKPVFEGITNTNVYAK